MVGPPKFAGCGEVGIRAPKGILFGTGNGLGWAFSPIEVMIMQIMCLMLGLVIKFYSFKSILIE